MKPLDPRLLRRARAARRYVVLTAGTGALTAALVIAQALLLAHALAPVVTREGDWPDVAPTVGWLAAVVALRALLTGAQERYAHRAATRTVQQLRRALLTHAVALGPRGAGTEQSTAVATLATRGLADLEPYFVRYLPQLLLAATVTPATLAVVLGLDWIAALTIAVTLPLVPLFMVLVGWLTQGYARRRLSTMARLGDQVMDLLAGLPTLKALGRETGPATRVRALGESHRRATMGTLRVAFLSGMVLELLTTLAVALVAVGVGFRLVYGHLDLTTALAVLVLAPEVYFPLRQVGAHFHASADGVAAAERTFEVLDRPVPAPGAAPAPDLRTATLTLHDVSVTAPERDTVAPAHLDLVLRPGEVHALTGPNGAGKSTAVAVVLGLLRPETGSVTVTAADGTRTPLHDLQPATWWNQITWVPQRAVLVPGTLADLVDDGRRISAVARTHAATLTGLQDVVDRLPHGWDTSLGHGGHGLSLGERQRLALTRALLARTPLVVLDEPTAHLDHDAEDVVVQAVRRLRESGRTVLLVSHRASTLAVADRVTPCTAASSRTEPAPARP
ncbi:thiol reductant ABC exporter subunit CydD [Cellulomonas bogoriensis]|uniref:Cysteine ABC transporter permease n=1 Tax=Cellulomonas bogoriensis 69B4 = DSM 16987 TaxID=1386082 RepID=A0A0A0BYT5_9CELL|nr:thiol reductant ABC exporter subunit CydD [Cellulomonas bogoriensis]KGM13091.1 cysteine ABC transporter permease [Cellulomonas bogoriensis 69B4 = DSM 16987]